MSPTSNAECRERSRNLLFMGRPDLWPAWPFLPLIRHRADREEDDYGVLFDVFHLDGRTGLSSTVFATNLFMMPPTVAEFLALPQERYDSVEEIYLAGWRVD
jgi:hypothetical protein